MIEEIVEKMEEFRQLILQDSSDVCDWEWININYGVNKIQMVAKSDTNALSFFFHFNERQAPQLTLRVPYSKNINSLNVMIDKPTLYESETIIGIADRVVKEYFTI